MIHVVDTFHLGRPRIIASHLLDLGPEHGLAMVDCGPESVFDNLVAGVRGLGRRPEEVRHLLLSHIHFDHAGAAWRWAREFGTTVYVHPRGEAHLLDPAALMSSATRIYGGHMGRLWGAMEPIPREKLRVVQDGEHLELGGGIVVRAVATPGHAQHHHAWWLESERAVFAGDVAGVMIPGGPVVPPCPPPDIHVEAWQESLARLRALRPEAVYVAHFGRMAEPEARFAELEERLLAWSNWMKERLREGREGEALVGEFVGFVADGLRAEGLDEEMVKDYEQANPAFMSVAGLSRYWRKFHPAVLELAN